jgi:hypothetical protein
MGAVCEDVVGGEWCGVGEAMRSLQDDCLLLDLPLLGDEVGFVRWAYWFFFHACQPFEVIGLTTVSTCRFACISHLTEAQEKKS